MTKIVCISDTHALHKNIKDIPDGDILIHAGDLTNKGELKDVESFNSWLKKLPHKHKIVIAGNHDFCFEQKNIAARELLTDATYLQDSFIILENLKIYGSPWQPWFYDWAFNLRRGEPLKAVWQQIPEDTDILITHGPPYGILDKTDNGDLVGCEELIKRIEKLRKLKLHVFGHIHEAYGQHKINNVSFVNASTCTLQYNPTNDAIVVEI